MALADSMLKYGLQKIKMSQASNLGNTISKIGDLGMEAGAALSKVAKATEPNRKAYETIQTGKKEVGIDDKGSFLEKTGLKSSLSSDKLFDVNIDEGGLNPRKVSYDTRGLKQIGTLSSTYSSDYLIEKYGQDWKEKYGVKSNIKTLSEDNKSVNKEKLEISFEDQRKNLINRSNSGEISEDEFEEGYNAIDRDQGVALSYPETKINQNTDKEESESDINNKELQKIKNKPMRSQSEIDKEEFLNALTSSTRSSVEDEFFEKHETIETYTETPKESNISNTASSLLPTEENQIEDEIINKFTKEDSPIIKEAPEDVSLKYQNIAKEEGLNFASSNIDKETGKTIYNLYNRKGKDFGIIFSMKDGKITKENPDFFENMKHFKELSFPEELYN